MPFQALQLAAREAGNITPIGSHICSTVTCVPRRMRHLGCRAPQECCWISSILARLAGSATRMRLSRFLQPRSATGWQGAPGVLLDLLNAGAPGGVGHQDAAQQVLATGVSHWVAGRTRGAAGSPRCWRAWRGRPPGCGSAGTCNRGQPLGGRAHQGCCWISSMLARLAGLATRMRLSRCLQPGSATGWQGAPGVLLDLLNAGALGGVGYQDAAQQVLAAGVSHWVAGRTRGAAGSPRCWRAWRGRPPECGSAGSCSRR